MAPDFGAADSGIVAILRGVAPAHALAIADVLYAAGIRVIEVPLNSPDPFRSISLLAAHPGPAGNVVGAGTVLGVADVRRTVECGGRLIVAPNCDVEVIRESARLGVPVMPGVATPTEAFTAIGAGATRLKLFPAASLGPAHLKALGEVLPAAVRTFAVGGVGAGDILGWLAAGAAGVGLGSALFRPELGLDEIGRRARQVVQALSEARLRLQAEQAGAKAADATGGGAS